MKKMIFLSLITLMACGKKDPESIQTPNETPSTRQEQEVEQNTFTGFQIPLEWASKAEASLWNKYVYDAIMKYGYNLLSVRPSDISEFSLNFDSFDRSEKINFWAYVLSALAKKESNHNPKTFYEESFTDSTGKPVISRGLLQLSYESARGYQCPITKGTDLHDPQTNIICGVKIMNRWIGRDKRITNIKGSKLWRGMARYWSVMRRPHKSFSFVKDSTYRQF